MTEASVRMAIESAKIIGADRPGWPEPLAPQAYHGLAGELIHLVEPHTEADPVAILIQFLVAFGSAAGRSPHFVAEADRHGVNLFAVCVGESAKGRKGVSWNHAKQPIVEADLGWKSLIRSGLSSGEGLIFQVRDGDGREDGDQGAPDKRMCVFEGEFASVLRVQGRESNTLSAILRNAWDGQDLRTLTRNNPLTATNAHISIIGHVTRDELLRYMNDTEAANGYGNRFLWICVKRSKCLPEGGQVPEEPLRRLNYRIRGVLQHAQSVGEMRRDPAARTIWIEVYEKLSEGRPGFLGSMTARGEAQVMRLAAIYALLDKSETIGAPHMLAALALWEYAEASARFIFGERTGDRDADAILNALREDPNGMTRTAISGLFQRNRPAARIDGALYLLRRMDLAAVTRETTGGKPAERWKAVSSSNSSIS